MEDNPGEVDDAFYEEMEVTDKKDDEEEDDTDITDGGNEEYILVDEDDEGNEEYEAAVSGGEEFVLVDRDEDEMSEHEDEDRTEGGDGRTRQRGEEFISTGLYLTDRIKRRPKSALHRFSLDKQTHLKDLSVLVAPISIDDFTEPKLKEQLEKCSHYDIKVSGSNLSNTTNLGHIVLRYKTIEAAEEAAESLSDFKENVTVDHLLSEPYNVENAVFKLEAVLKNQTETFAVENNDEKTETKHKSDDEEADTENPEEKPKTETKSTVRLMVTVGDKEKQRDNDKQGDTDKPDLQIAIKELFIKNGFEIVFLKRTGKIIGRWYVDVSPGDWEKIQPLSKTEIEGETITIEKAFSSGCILFVRNLPEDVTHEELMQVFPGCTSISMYKRKKNTGMRCAYIEYNTEAEVNAAYEEKRGKQIRNNTLIFSMGKKSLIRLNRQLKVSAEVPVEYRTVYVSHVPKDVTEERLKETFEDAVSVLIPRDLNRAPKGYAYLEYETAKGAHDAAEKYKDVKIDGTELTVRKLFQRSSHYLRNLSPLPFGAIRPDERQRLYDNITDTMRRLRSTAGDPHFVACKTLNEWYESLVKDIEVREKCGLSVPKRVPHDPNLSIEFIERRRKMGMIGHDQQKREDSYWAKRPRSQSSFGNYGSGSNYESSGNYGRDSNYGRDNNYDRGGNYGRDGNSASGGNYGSSSSYGRDGSRGNYASGGNYDRGGNYGNSFYHKDNYGSRGSYGNSGHRDNRYNSKWWRGGYKTSQGSSSGHHHRGNRGFLNKR